MLFLSRPAEDRGETVEAFCNTIGITERTLVRWKAKPEFAQALDKSRKAYDTSSDFYALCVRRKALELLDEGLAMPIGTGKGQLTSSERRQYIAAALAETKQVSDSLDTIDRSHMQDHELIGEILGRGNPAELIEVVDILKGCSWIPSSPSSPEPSPQEPDSFSDTVPEEATDLPQKPAQPKRKRSGGKGSRAGSLPT